MNKHYLTYQLFILLSLVLFYSCQKPLGLLNPPLTGSKPDNTFRKSSLYDVGDAVWYDNTMVVTYHEPATQYLKAGFFRFESDSTGRITKLSEIYSKAIPNKIQYKENTAYSEKGNLVVWGDKLMAITPGFFMVPPEYYASNPVVHINVIDYSSDRPKDAKITYMNRLNVSCPGAKNSYTFASPAATQYQGYLYMLVQLPDVGKIALVKSTTDTPTNSPSWEFVSWLQKFDGMDLIYSTNNTTIDCIYDIATGFTMEGETLKERLYVGVKMNKSELQISEWDGNTWKHHNKKLTKSFDGGSFKLQQGIIAGHGQSQNLYALQAICSENNNVISIPFYTQTNTMGNETTLTNHNGAMASSTVLIPSYARSGAKIPYKFTSYIAVVQGNQYNYMDIDTYKSNEITITSTSQAPISMDTYLTNKNLRPLCALIGIIEGPPPTLVSRREDFSSIYPLAPTTLTISNSQSTTYNYNFTIEHSLGLTVKAEKKSSPEANSAGISAQYGIKAALGKTFGYSSQKEINIQEEISSTYETCDYAKLLYSVPDLCLYNYYMKDPDGGNIFSAPIYSALITQSLTYRTVGVNLNEAPFNISTPSDMYQWTNRIDDVSASGTAQSFPLEYTFGGSGTTTTASISDQYIYSNSVTSRLESTFSLGGDDILKYFNFNIDASCGFVYNYSWDYSVGRGISIMYNQLDQGSGSDAIYNPGNIHKYTVNTYLLQHNNTNSSRYYNALKNRSDQMIYLMDDEKPWILAYEVGDIITF